MQVTNSEYIESVIQHKLPEDYCIFLNTYGVAVINFHEIYGYRKGMNITEFPCVLAATKVYRKMKIIGDDELAICSSDEYIVSLNLSSGIVYKNYISGEKIKLSATFSEWLHELEK